MRTKFFIFYLMLLLLSVKVGFSTTKSGGTLLPEQASYDVSYYHLNLLIDPELKAIAGSLLCEANVVSPIDSFILDLDARFVVDSVWFKIDDASFLNVNFIHVDGLLNIPTTEQTDSGRRLSVQVFYGGNPKVSQSPPWDDGFVWRTTTEGKPWLGVACETSGADVWWPCKDHPSDEPDSMHISLTVPNPLSCVSNGRFIGKVENSDSTTTFNWFVSTPINNYNVTFYAAEYQLIEDQYLSISGDSIPFYFWVLPEDYNIALDYMDVFKEEFDFLESICGPFPFSNDKHGWAHAPYWGMEHQTIIAYGHNFTVNDWGYDYIHYHELAHEWWGNHITAENWADVWIHEGIATYTEALYVEHLKGVDSYFNFMRKTKPSNYHDFPLAPTEDYTAAQAFDNLNPYRRGAAVMHTFRYHLGDSTFFEVFKRWIYPDANDFDNTNGRQCRILGTEDLKEQAEQIAYKDLSVFFDVFFREASYPDLLVERSLDSATFIWKTEGDVLLDLNIPILLNGLEQIVEMNNGQGAIAMILEDELEVDPNSWILMGQVYIVEDEITNNSKLVDTQLSLKQNYPNPFSGSSVIEFSTQKKQFVSLKVYNAMGDVIEILVCKELLSGEYKFVLDARKYRKGMYWYSLQAASFFETKSFVVE